MMKMASDVGEIKGVVKGLKSNIKTLDENNNAGHETIIKHQEATNGKVTENTKFRLQTQAQISLVKWLIGVLGIGNIVGFISLFIK